MKAYITCPASHTSERLDLLPFIKEVVEFCDIEPFVFIIGGEPKEIFERDYGQLKSSDIIIAEVSERSHGVGIEIGMAHCFDLWKILLIEKGNFVTRLAQGMPKTIIIEYSNKENLKKSLEKKLKEIKSSSS